MGFFGNNIFKLKTNSKQMLKQTKPTLKEGNIYSHYNLQEGLSALKKFLTQQE